MIFPSESLYELRRSLVAQMDSGEITEEEGARRALEADPDDSAALRFLSLTAARNEDRDSGARYVDQLIRVHPSDYLGYFLRAALMKASDTGAVLQVGYLILALEKVLFNQKDCEALDMEEIAAPYNAIPLILGLDNDEAVLRLLEILRDRYEGHLESVGAELWPHKLIHELREYRDDVLSPSTVDGILKESALTAPLLMGILKEFAEGLLTEDDFSMVERALALLGEIGDPAFLPALAEFVVRETEDISGPADWAFRRITFRRPEESLAKIQEMIPAMNPAERVAVAQQIAMMPHITGRTAALASLVEDLPRFPKLEQEGLLIGTIAGALLTEGEKSFLAASLEHKYAALFTKDGRADLKLLHKEMKGIGPDEAEEDELTVYDICCREPYPDEDENDEDEDDEDDEEGPVAQVIAPPRPGRNDPCWCGSGKKYKKCHLDHDEQH